MHEVTVADRRARLARRHRLAPEVRAKDVESATSSMVCLHGTDPATVFLSARARVDDMVVADLEEALYSRRSLVKHLAMRRTLFVFPAETLDVVQAAVSARIAASESKRLVREVEKAGLYDDGEAWLEKASAAVLGHLADGHEATWVQLRGELPVLSGTISYGEGRSWGGEYPVGPRVLNVLSAAGQLVRATNDGAWTSSRPRWTTMRSWIGRDLDRPGEATARAELVRRWLYTFGPGTERDLTWWLGSTVTAARKALHDVGAVEVQIDGASGFLLPDDLDPVDPVEPWAALLPGLDPTVMGWADRGWYLQAHRENLFDRNGNAGPTAWWDGRIVGGWHQRGDGEVVVDLLEEVADHARAALQVEAGRLTGWLDGVLVTHRFPSPLGRQRAEAERAAAERAGVRP